MKAGIETQGWEGFKTNAINLGWNDSKYLLTDDQLKTMADDKTAKEAEAKKKSEEEVFNTRVTQLSEALGLESNAAAQLVQKKLNIFTPAVDNPLEQNLQKYLDEKQ